MMSLVSKSSGSGDFTPAPAGVHRAVCLAVIDLGTQESEYQGAKSFKEQVLVMWELCDEMIQTDDGEKPLVISKFYTNSLHEKANLRHDLESWRSREFTAQELDGFDLLNVLGVACQLNVVHKTKANGKQGAYVSAVMPLSKGMEAKKTSVTPWKYDTSDGQSFPEQLSDGIKGIILKCKEFTSPAVADADGCPPPEEPNYSEADDDIPF